MLFFISLSLYRRRVGGGFRNGVCGHCAAVIIIVFLPERSGCPVRFIRDTAATGFEKYSPGAERSQHPTPPPRTDK